MTLASDGIPTDAGLLEAPERWQVAVDRLQRLARMPYVVLALIVVFAFCIYLPTLNDWFQTDDFVYLRDAQVNDSPHHLLHAWNFREKTHQTMFPVQGFYAHYQPLYEVTIVSETELFGLRALPYHVISLLLHLTNGVLLWLIVLRLTRRPLIAHLAALIFLVHPTYAYAVAWISDQVALSATTCSLLALLAFIESLGTGAKFRRWYIISVVSFAAAVLFHPKAAFVLAALGGYYFFVYASDLRALLSPRAWLRFAPYVLVALFLLSVGLWLQHQDPNQGAFGYGPHIYKSYEDYLRMAVIPDPWLSGTRLRAAGGVVWLCISFWLLRDTRYRSVGLLGLAWLAASLFPLTTFKWGAFNRELYTAGPAVALLLAVFSISLLDRLPKRTLVNALVVAAFAAALVVVGKRTVRNEDIVAGYATESHSFIQQMQAVYPTLPAKASVYVVGTPFSLGLFADIHLNELGQVYYGDIELHTVSAAKADEIEQAGQANTFVFRYLSQ